MSLLKTNSSVSFDYALSGVDLKMNLLPPGTDDLSFTTALNYHIYTRNRITSSRPPVLCFCFGPACCLVHKDHPEVTVSRRS